MNAEAPGAISLHDTKRGFTVDGKEIALTDTEFRVLKALATKPGVLVTRPELTHALYGDKRTVAPSNVIEVLISRLRAKFSDHGLRAAIKTTRGVGYTFVGQVQ